MSEERVHELLYSCDSRTELCEMIARLEDENAKLQASNEIIAEDHAALCEHNTKLRELCETFGMIANDAICDYYERDEMLAQANEDARELGVEVS